MEEFPSGQRGQTVNLLRFASVVRIHPPPPHGRKVRFAAMFFYPQDKKHAVRRLSVILFDPHLPSILLFFDPKSAYFQAF